MLSDEEIVRRLRGIRHSSSADRYGHRITSISEVAKAAGFTRAAVYLIIQNGRLTRRSKARLSDALQRCQGEGRAKAIGHTLEDAARGRF